MTQNSSARRTKQATRVLNVIAVVVVLTLLVPFVVYAFPPIVGGDTSYVVLTGSMEPSISPGDVIIVASVDPSTLAVGDVVTFSRDPNNPPVTHRINEIGTSETGEPVFITKGDANEDVDQAPVMPAQVVGRVLFTIPVMGYVISFANSPLGYIALIAIPFGLLLITEVWSLVRPQQSTEQPIHDDEGAIEDGAPPGVDETSEEAGSGFTLTKTDLGISLAVLGAFALYAGYTAFETRTPVSIAVTVGTVTTFLVAVAVRQFGMTAVPATAHAASDGGVDVATTADEPTDVVEPHDDGDAVATGDESNTVARDPDIDGEPEAPPRPSRQPVVLDVTGNVVKTAGESTDTPDRNSYSYTPTNTNTERPTEDHR